MHKEGDILFICSVMDLKLGAGIAERTYQLARELTKSRKVGIVTCDIGDITDRLNFFQKPDVLVFQSFSVRFNIPMIRFIALSRLIKKFRYIHLIGHWDFLNFICFCTAQFFGTKVIFTPAGALPYFGRSRLLKKIYNQVIGYKIARLSDIKVCITEDEISHFFDYGVDSSKLSLVPNGVSLPDYLTTQGEQGYYLYLGRLNHIKGVDLLLEAFLKQSRAGKVMIPLYIVGPDNGLKVDLIQQVKDSGLAEMVEFKDFVSGPEKDALFLNSLATIIPSRQEAMSLVALEAVAAGAPVIASDMCGLDDLIDLHPHAKFSLNSREVEAALSFFSTRPDEALALHARQYRIVEERYAWPIQARKIIDLMEYEIED